MLCSRRRRGVGRHGATRCASRACCCAATPPCWPRGVPDRMRPRRRNPRPSRPASRRNRPSNRRSSCSSGTSRRCWRCAGSMLAATSHRWRAMVPSCSGTWPTARSSTMPGCRSIRRCSRAMKPRSASMPSPMRRMPAPLRSRMRGPRIATPNAPARRHANPARAGAPMRSTWRRASSARIPACRCRPRARTPPLRTGRSRRTGGCDRNPTTPTAAVACSTCPTSTSTSPIRPACRRNAAATASPCCPPAAGRHAP